MRCPGANTCSVFIATSKFRDGKQRRRLKRLLSPCTSSVLGLLCHAVVALRHKKEEEATGRMPRLISRIKAKKKKVAQIKASKHAAICSRSLKGVA